MEIETLQKIVRDAGFKNSSSDFENEDHIYAFSVESYGPATYGHPKFTAHFHKTTGWLDMDGRPPVKLICEECGRTFEDTDKEQYESEGGSGYPRICADCAEDV